MIKKFICIALALSLTLTLSACFNSGEEDYLPGVAFDPADYDTGAVTRYENKLYGIILEYPEKYQRVGNFDLDGYVTFEGDGVQISVYVPDTENNDILTVEEYVADVLELTGDEGSGLTKYGKSSGYKIIRRTINDTRIDFIVKGVDAFYRFAYSTTDAEFTEEDEGFQNVMGSIRIDDGVYNKLMRMSNRYTLLLEYAVNMDYITEANYANHCLNNLEQSGEERHKTDALAATAGIRAALGEIINHKREEGEGYDEYWDKITARAKEIIESCSRAEAAINEGDNEKAQAILRTEFNYDLSEIASKFISIINAEIAEY